MVNSNTENEFYLTDTLRFPLTTPRLLKNLDLL